MKLIALTGGIGSGKSTVLNEFKKLGAFIISCDEISHRIMLPGGSAYREVREAFGDVILTANGEIDRKKLASIVFSDNKKLEIINGITHRLIYSEIKKQTENVTAAVICVEIPLLFTTECPLDIDYRIAVIADDDIRIERVIKRDNVSCEDVKVRMEKQLSNDEMSKKADFVIENNGDMKALKERTEYIYGLVL